MDIKKALNLIADKAVRNPVIIDVASGSGTFTMPLAAISNAKVLALDASPQMLSRAKERINGLKNVEFVQAEANRIPAKNHSADILTCRLGFHHFENPLEMLKEVKRVLKPQGTAIIVEIVPKHPVAFNLVQKMRDPSHVRHYTIKEMELMCSVAGLRVVSIHDMFTEHTSRDILEKTLRGRTVMKFLLLTGLYPLKRNYKIFELSPE